VWREQYQPEAEELRNNQFADALRSTVPSLTRARMSHSSDKHCRDKRIVKTQHDRNNRAECWLGIAPQAEWCFTRSEAA